MKLLILKIFQQPYKDTENAYRKPPVILKIFPEAGCDVYTRKSTSECLAFRVFTTFRILEISYISNVFFCFVYIRKWPKFHEILRIFSMQIYTKFCGISRNSVTCYTNFFNDSAQTTFSTHSRETSRRWLGVGEVRQYTPQPLPLHCCHSLKKLV
jgi:hypothetical protein